MTLKDYVDWKLAHPQGYMSRNIYRADIVYCIAAGWNLSRDGRVVTDSSITTYATTDAAMGNLVIYLDLDIKQYAGKTLSMTFTAETEFAYAVPTRMFIKTPYQSGNTLLVEGTQSTTWDGGYFNSIAIPEDIDATAVLQITIYGRNFTTGDEIKYDNIMIYEGTEPLPYEPYTK